MLVLMGDSGTQPSVLGHNPALGGTSALRDTSTQQGRQTYISPSRGAG